MAILDEAVERTARACVNEVIRTMVEKAIGRSSSDSADALLAKLDKPGKPRPT